MGVFDFDAFDWEDGPLGETPMSASVLIAREEALADYALLLAKRHSYDIRDFGGASDGTTDDSTAIADTFDEMKADGTHATGVLYIPPGTLVESAIVLDGGYATPAYTDTNWIAGAGEAFEVIAPRIKPGTSSVGAVLTVKQMYNARILVHFEDGGHADDDALYLEDLLNPQVSVSGTNYAGTLLHTDRPSSSKRIVGGHFPRVRAVTCGRALHIDSIEGGNHFGSVYDLNCAAGSLFESCADVNIEEWESFTPDTQTYGLEFTTCNNFNVGRISMGDRPTTALVRIADGDFGQINQIRVSGRPDVGTDPQITGLLLDEVDSIDIDTLKTFRCDKGLHIIGGGTDGGIRVKRHFSLTTDRNPLYIEGGGSQTTPDIAIGAHYRYHREASVVVASSITGGRLRLSGRLKDMWLDGASTHYAIECASTGMVLDVADLYHVSRSGLAGSISHADATKVVGVRNARLEQNVVHGAAPATRSVTAGVAQQNASGSSLMLSIVVSMDLGGGDAFGTLYVGPSSGTLAIFTRTTEEITGASGTERKRAITAVIPPWWWFRLDTANASISADQTTAYAL